ncbi:hypothetical protein FFA01_25380 [Frigoribacterium faeni]|uniref:Uncharacterized protein n=1 Tax=Frigoribacterium faeni TaxID=145483 RepID=A0ABQ0URY2_9MICO|nr:hypothetical protein FFA01_25380 [Frigoribacterium faeni]
MRPPSDPTSVRSPTGVGTTVWTITADADADADADVDAGVVVCSSCSIVTVGSSHSAMLLTP